MSKSDGISCPECPHDGAFDGQGRTKDTHERLRSENYEWEKVKEVWYQFRCTQCGAVFKVRQKKAVIEREAE